MKRIPLLAAGLVLAAVFYAFTSKRPPAAKPFDVAAFKAARMVSCTPDRAYISQLLDKLDIMPMPGAGSYKWNIPSTNDSARFYFNQGINMYYGFHIIEALASFKKAATFDPQDPMVWWAQALAYGPNINDVGYAAAPDALEASKKALALKEKATPPEQMLIDAMTSRYSADTTISRAQLNQAYVDALYKAYQKFPNQPDVAALYADALMLQHPWDYWHPNGRPKLWTPLIRSVLESLLTRAPKHPGANHYYIHVMEASPFAAEALPSAERLGALTPGLSHMVHMPSHIYLRTGHYQKGAQVNEEAVAQYEKYKALFPAVQENAFIYLWHNRHMQATNALQAGRYDYAKKTALELQQVMDTAALSLPAPLGAAMTYLYMTPVLVDVHFGKWQSLLDLPRPADQNPYANVLYHFARGMGQAGLGKTAEATQELASLTTRLRDTTLKIPMASFSPAIEGATVAEKLLEGFIALKEGRRDSAIAAWEKASRVEENMVYMEPRDWLVSPKQFLGTAYLEAGQWAKAEEIFRSDLQMNAQNAWSLQGLLKALEQQGDKQDQKEVKKLREKLSKAAASGELVLVKRVL
ncbi:hypothetical protein V9K67_14000 [Paraflavisolibacter sp. H34]|uniref:tetratricopeptide repeat protein n=1 Tax=Huijunlia imazamoxiresistens TaxID=3127457 RepID=UPI0030162567